MVEFKPSYKLILSNDIVIAQEKKDEFFTPKFKLPDNIDVVDRRSRITGSRFKSRLIYNKNEE